MLTQRLEGLEAAGVLTRRKLPPPASAQVYELTPWGYESEPIFQALGRWAARSPPHDPTLPLSARLAAAVAAHHARSGAGARASTRGSASASARRPSSAHLADGGIDDRAGGPRRRRRGLRPATPRVIAAAIYGGQPLDALEAAGALRVEGDRALAERFVTLFPLPPKAGA